MRFRLPALLLTPLLMLGAPLRAEPAAETRIDVWPPTPDAGTPVRFTVKGEWPDACTPKIRDARIEGHDVVLDAELASDHCAGPAQAFETGTHELEPGKLKLAANGIYRVRFEVRRAPAAPPELHGFRLFHAGNAVDPGFVPETGFWWPENGGEHDDAGPGVGVHLEVQARTLSLSVYGYDDDGGDSWMLGAGAMSGHTAQVELSRLSNGAGPFDAYRAPKALTQVGSVHLELHSPSRATLWFVRPTRDGHGLQARPMSVVRFRFAQDAADAWLGRWVVLAESDVDLPTLRIDFASVTREEGGFTLGDTGGDYRLRCELAAKRPNSPPSRCRLVRRDGTALDVDFDHVALNELRGWNGAGQRIVALKLNR